MNTDTRATTRRDSPPEPEALVDFVAAHKFIIAVPRTKLLLDVLAKTGLLVRKGRTVRRDDGSKRIIFRYTKG